MKPAAIAFGVALLTSTAVPAMAVIPEADEAFAANAARGGLAEVSLGHLATVNGGSAAVRQFGQRMVTDHTQANEALEQIAKQENFTVPNRPDAEDQKTEKSLSGLKGKAFDTAYMRDMVQDHRKDIAEFQQEINVGKNPALKAFAQKYLPVLQQHLQMAEAAQSAS